MQSINEKYKKIHSELRDFFPMIELACSSVRNEGVSKYPIIVASKLPIEVGIQLVSQKKSDSKWNIYISTLEEFSAKQLIRTNRLQEFKKIFKDPDLYYCVFVLSDLGAQFVFIPL